MCDRSKNNVPPEPNYDMNKDPKVEEMFKAINDCVKATHNLKFKGKYSLKIFDCCAKCMPDGKFSLEDCPKKLWGNAFDYLQSKGQVYCL